MQLPQNGHNQSFIVEQLVNIACSEQPVGTGELRADENAAILFSQPFPLPYLVGCHIERIGTVTGDDYRCGLVLPIGSRNIEIIHPACNRFGNQFGLNGRILWLGDWTTCDV